MGQIIGSGSGSASGHDDNGTCVWVWDAVNEDYELVGDCADPGYNCDDKSNLPPTGVPDVIITAPDPNE